MEELDLMTVMMTMIIIIRPKCIIKPNQKQIQISQGSQQKIKHLNKYMKMSYQKKTSKFGICKTKMFIDKKFGKLKETDYNKNTKWK